eukprot:TRINITY_DN5911_c0_g1_i1.p1 TRINITY_DN5911_c0_g1~~TRINITY_DN5911_c0_g1_i1.p1  ORF type:complete len:660 (+),score=170.59 TRINITY_DN5911_c0_g1_i1:68-2047(+)
MGCICSIFSSCCGCNKVEDPKTRIGTGADRHLTDILFFLLFLASFGGLAYIIGVARSNGGNISKIIRGVDPLGNICGKSDGYKHLPYAVFPLISDPEYFDVKFCSASCNESQDARYVVTPYPSKLWTYYCLPTAEAFAAGVSTNSHFDSASRTASRAMGDLSIAWPIILASCFMSIIGAFLYARLIQTSCANCFVWGFILLIVLGGFLTSYAFLKYAQNAADSGNATTRASAMRGLGWTIAAVTFIFLCVIYFLWDKIVDAINLVKVSGEAVSDMWQMVFFPLYPFLFAAGYAILWIFTVMYLFSVTEEETKTIASPELLAVLKNRYPGEQLIIDGKYIDNVFQQKYMNLFIYAVFHFLWMCQFLIYFTFFVLACTTAQWYFAADRKNRAKVSETVGCLCCDGPVCLSTRFALRYHMGTIALASLIVATITFIRMIVKFLEEKSKAASGGQPNKCQQWLFCAIKCCLRCAECCMDKVSKNALIWTAIWGHSFIPACCSSFKLIFDNLRLIAAVTAISGYLLFLGKLFICFIVTGICGIIFLKVNYFEDNMSSVVMPLVVIFILAYLIGTMFMGLLDMVIDAILLCYLSDMKSSGGQPTFAPDQLKHHLDDPKIKAKNNAIADRYEKKGAPAEASNASVQPEYQPPNSAPQNLAPEEKKD